MLQLKQFKLPINNKIKLLKPRPTSITYIINKNNLKINKNILNNVKTSS
jgi:hypothetical protein